MDNQEFYKEENIAQSEEQNIAPAQPKEEKKEEVKEQPKKVLSVLGFVFGCVAFSVHCLGFLGIPGLILTAQAKKKGQEIKGLNIAARVTSIIGIVLFAIWVLTLPFKIASWYKMYKYHNYNNNYYNMCMYNRPSQNFSPQCGTPIPGQGPGPAFQTVPDDFSCSSKSEIKEEKCECDCDECKKNNCKKDSCKKDNKNCVKENNKENKQSKENYKDKK